MGGRGPVVTLTLTSDDKTKPGFNSAEGNADRFGDSVKKVGLAVGAFAVGAGLAIGGFALKSIGAFSDLALKADEFSNKTGLAVEDASRWLEAAGDLGINTDAVSKAIGKMNNVLGKSPEMFAELGVEIARNADGTEDVNQTFLNTIAALQGIEDPADRNAAAQQLLGKGWTELSEIMADVPADELASALADVSDAKVIDEAEVEKAKRMRAAMDNLKDKFEDVQLAIGEKLVPAITAGVTWLDEKLGPAVQSVAGWVQNSLMPAIGDFVALVQEKWPQIQAAIEPVLTWFQETTQTVLDIVQGLWSVFGDTILAWIVATFENIRLAIEGAMQVIKGIIDTVLGLLTGDWGRAWDGIKAIAEGVWKLIEATIGQIITNIKAQISGVLAALGSLMSGAWDGIQSTASTAWGAIETAITAPFTEAADLISGAVDEIVGFISGLPGRITDLAGDLLSAGSSIGSSVVEGIVDGLSGAASYVGSFATAIASAAKTAAVSAVNWIIDKLNSALEFSVDGPGFLPDINFNPPNIPRLSFHTGGIVPDAGEVMALLEGKEMVLNDDQQARLFALANGATAGTRRSGNTYINVPAGYRPADIARLDRLYRRRNGYATAR